MKELQLALEQVVKHHFPDYNGPVTIDIKFERDDFDYSSPIAFSLAKHAGQSPPSIAEMLAHDLHNQLGESVSVFIAPDAPPFINFKLDASYWAKLLHGIQHGPSQNTLYQNKHVLVEFLSANPTGPATLANGRGGYTGDALANVYASAGAKVEREYYVNDTGNQITQLGKSIIAQRNGEEIEDGYKGEYIKELAEKIDGDLPEEVGKKAADLILNEWIKPVTQRMGITFDHFFSERELIQTHAIDQAIGLLSTHGLLYEQDGATWLKTTKYGDDKDRVVKRSDGTHTYLLADIAYHWQKIKRGVSTMVTIVGADHFTEVKTLELIVKKFLIPTEKREVEFYQPMYQFVRLIENGQEIKMSKRAGTYVSLDDLLDRVNSDVARFFFVWNANSNQMDFDLNLASEASDQNPVYYTQYALVRAKHVLDNNQIQQNIPPSEISLTPTERNLLLYLLEFDQLITTVLSTQEVHHLAHYAIELSRRFHSFYAAHPILKAEGTTRDQRLALTSATLQTLNEVLKLIGVSQPEKMMREV